MVRFLVLYRRPPDPAAFDRHYFDVHVPLAKRLPGLRSYMISRNPSLIRGEEPPYLIGELEWDDMAALQRAFASPTGRETARDADRLADLSGGMQSMIFEAQAL